MGNLSAVIDTIVYYIGGDYNQDIVLYEDDDFSQTETIDAADTVSAVLMDLQKRAISSEISISTSAPGSDLANGKVICVITNTESTNWKQSTAQWLVKRIRDVDGKIFYYPILPFVEIRKSPI